MFSITPIIVQKNIYFYQKTSNCSQFGPFLTYKHSKYCKNRAVFIRFPQRLPHKYHLYALVLYICSVISKMAEIGTFWPFLATFGIEIVIRCQKLFFPYSLLMKAMKLSVRKRCTMHTTFIFSDFYLGKTQKLDFL